MDFPSSEMAAKAEGSRTGQSHSGVHAHTYTHTYARTLAHPLAASSLRGWDPGR